MCEPLIAFCAIVRPLVRRLRIRASDRSSTAVASQSHTTAVVASRPIHVLCIDQNVSNEYTQLYTPCSKVLLYHNNPYWIAISEL